MLSRQFHCAVTLKWFSFSVCWAGLLVQLSSWTYFVDKFKNFPLQSCETFHDPKWYTKLKLTQSTVLYMCLESLGEQAMLACIFHFSRNLPVIGWVVLFSSDMPICQLLCPKNNFSSSCCQLSFLCWQYSYECLWNVTSFGLFFVWQALNH